MLSLDWLMWLFAIIVGVLVGFAKTGVATMGIFNVTLMTQIFSAKDSVGILLPMLIVGDIIAVVYYRKSVVWKYLFRLVPWVLTGILIGYVVLTMINSEELKLMIGILILALVVMQIVKERLGSKLDEVLPNALWFTACMGVLGGFATMIGNVAGTIMAVYLLAMRLPKQEFVGTGAWFFLFVNLIKVPFYIHLSMITVQTLSFNAVMIPFICLGAFLGIKILPRIPQKMFQSLVLILGAVGALRMILPDSLQYYFLAVCVAAVLLYAGVKIASGRKAKAGRSADM